MNRAKTIQKDLIWYLITELHLLEMTEAIQNACQKNIPTEKSHTKLMGARKRLEHK